MAGAPDTTPTTNPVLDWLYERRKGVAYVLLGLALLVAIFLVVSLFARVSNARMVYGVVPLAPIGGLLFLIWLVLIPVFMVGGLIAAIQADSPAPDARDRFRLLLVTVGGLAGLTLAFYGVALPFQAEYAATFAGGLGSWRDNPGAVFWPLFAFLVGLGLLFVSLNLIRGAERSSGLMRRLLYGYNVVLSSVLLLLILLIANVLVYAQIRPFNVFGQTFDFTETGMYSLAPATETFLQKLNQPVVVYVLASSGVPTRELQNLLDTAKTFTPNLKSEMLNRDRNRDRIAELHSKYNIPDPVGALVVYGTGKDEVSHFISYDKLFPEVTRQSLGRFYGENAFYQALTTLAEGKAKPVVHALQGHDELNLSSRDAAGPDFGLGRLKTYLDERNYDLVPFQFDLQKPAVPEDVSVLLIARPLRPLASGEIDALRDFLKGVGRKQKGKLIVLTDVVPDRADAKRFLNTGLEGLLSEFGVGVRNERLLALKGPGRLDEPTLIDVGPFYGEPFLGNAIVPVPVEQPIGAAFVSSNNRTPFTFLDARPVEATPNNPGAPSPYRGEPFLFASMRDELWVETDLATTRPAARAAELSKNRAEFAKVAKNDFVPVALAVSERSNQPIGPHGETGEEPRLVVFGDATWASNYGIAGNDLNGALFFTTVNWLRGRPDLGEPVIKPGEPATFKFDPKDEDLLRLLLLPGALLLLGIVGLGLGVWVVRRR